MYICVALIFNIMTNLLKSIKVLKYYTKFKIEFVEVN